MVVDDKIYVAVCRELTESKSKLKWALKKSNGKKICIFLIHVPAKKIPLTTGEIFPANQVAEEQVKAFREQEKRELLKILDDYTQFCEEIGMNAEKMVIEMDSIEKGILEFICQRRIGRLVIGAAADSRYSRKMVEPDSFKAIFVRHHAPAFCHIWFVCKGRLIYTREAVGQPSLDVERISLNSCENDQSDAGLLREEVRETGPPTMNKHQGSSPPSVLAKTAKRVYREEVREREKIEEELAELKERLKMTKRRHEEVLHKFHELKTQLEKSRSREKEMETQLEKSRSTEKEMEEKILSVEESLQKYKTKLDELQVERDCVLRETEELRKQLPQGPSSSHIPFCYSVFSSSDLQNATKNFDSSLKIGEGGYGSIYKGFLYCTEVAIKIHNPDSMQGPQEFELEVDVLSKLRHPNLVTLIGACRESWALVYEYLPGGSLEDRLTCKDHTPPLPWQTRIQVATELCSVLIFLHSSCPSKIIHGDLKPSNILLDNNFVCKLGDFGICCVITNSEETARFCTSQLRGTFAYMDPEFLTTGELTTKSDIYSFGIIMLRLLTGKPALGIAREVQSALDEGNLKIILDPSAGGWPFVQAKQLACMALRCCDKDVKNRPDLGSDVWRLLEPMKTSSRSLPMLRMVSDDRAPDYFICPIFQEIMEYPWFASDGFTYEAEAIRGWVDRGHNTSPMTNEILANHDFIPNHALRSAIQDWKQLHRSV